MKEHHLDCIGDTPMVKVALKGMDLLDLFIKLELYNPTGSVKDRAAAYILKKGLAEGTITRSTTIIESSSGNFGVALSNLCNRLNLRFVCVVDPCISPINEFLIRSQGAELLKVTEPDRNGGFLLTRIKTVKQFLRDTPDSFWVNQYGNPNNAMAYYHTLGEEICSAVDPIDYLFLGVSSGGTITGLSNRVKDQYPNACIVGVDIYGSVIFGNPAKKRYIPGIGSSMVPEILAKAKIDDVVMVDEVATLLMCHEMLREHSIFAGGSSGSVIAGIRKYFRLHPPQRRVNVVTVFPDRGERYVNTVYNEEWCRHFVHNLASDTEPADLAYAASLFAEDHGLARDSFRQGRQDRVADDPPGRTLKP